MDKRHSNFTDARASLEDGYKTKTKSQNINVVVRVRPVLKSEFGKETAVTCSMNKKTVNINTNTNLIQSTLDGAFDETATQQEIFNQVKGYIPAVIQGYNCTIFAYGQTGSGKTHTMFGSDWENVMFNNQGNSAKIQKTFISGDLDDDNNFSGLIPRTIYHLFQEIQKEENKSQSFSVYCSFLQIYNEKIFDLLVGGKTANSLPIRENKIDGIYVEGLTEYCVTNFQECLLLMQKGEKNRFIRHTSNNVKSSRSHTIFQLIVESTRADSTGKLQKAKFNLCDLAGSEKLNKSEDIVNAHLSELKNINLSLTTLGKVIHNLSSDKKLPIPYRESKLTRLLQDSLGGNTNTCLIATLSPILEYVDESLNTLKFAERAKHIVTEVKANKIEAVDAELITKLQKEIKYLKEILNIRRKGTSAINQVHNKLLILQEENDRLRQAHLSVPEVEKLIQENRSIRLELQQFKSENQQDSQSEKYEANPKDFEVTGGLTRYMSQGHASPFSKSIMDPAPNDILDTIQEGGQKSFRKRGDEEASQFQKSTNVFDLGTHYTRNSRSPDGFNSPHGYNSPHGSASPFTSTGKLISQMASGKKEPGLNPLALLPSRIKGKTNSDIKAEAGKPPRELNRSYDKKKEQQRALQRLQNLEEWQKRIKEKEISNTSSSSKQKFPSLSKQPSETASSYSVNSADKSNAYKFADFDKLYDPYKVRQEIEQKYNTKPRNLVGRGLRPGGEDYNRIKNIEKNFF